MVSCILLSAGLSQRFGSPKALACLSGKTAIGHLLDSLLNSACQEIIVVLGAYAEKIQPFILKHSRIQVVYNKDYNFGQTSSVQAGWRKASDLSEGLLMLPVDCPLVKTRSIDTIISHFIKERPDILVPTFQGRKGHPPVFSHKLKNEALSLSVDKGLNSLFASHPPQTIGIDDPGIVESFNTQQELELIISKQSL